MIEQIFGGGGRLLIIIIAAFLVTLISIIKYCSNEVNYSNADATWHTLLTIEAYNETPASEHLFLPIVSLGNTEDKFIPWGDTIPDEHGNYYYTSFSSAGYFVPWLFMKILQLNVCEKSLYIFNSLLFAISAALWGIFIFWIFEFKKSSMWISIIGMFTYVLSPELLHGMGIVYWHQSLMQVTLLVQIMAFWKMKRVNSKPAKVLFYIFSFLNPYIEWTGYIANVGFALAGLFSDYKKDSKKAFRNVLLLGAITLFSFCIFVGHYLLRVDAALFFQTLKNRFTARNITTSVKFTDMFGSYLNSFLFLWILLFILIIWNIVKKQSIELKHGMLMFILVFPIIENIVMKQHATAYTYDKMKGGFLLSFLICELIYQLWDNSKYKKATVVIASGLVIITGILNLESYIQNNAYTWDTSYREENRQIAAYINEHYPEAVLGIENRPVRGYMNLLFGKGIYEFMSANDLKSIAIERKKQYAITLEVENSAPSQVYDMYGAIVYDVCTGKSSRIIITTGEVADIELYADKTSVYQLSSLTDQNWTMGYSNTENILLFQYNENLLKDLFQGKNIICKGKVFPIENIDFDSQWIRVSVKMDASVCKYPNYIQIE